MATTVIRSIGTLSKTVSLVSGTGVSPIEVTTSTTHGLTTGQYLKVASVGGNTNANGSWQITVVNTTKFTLDGTSPNANYTSGGAVTRDYATLDAWEIDTDIDLVAADQVHYGYIYRDTVPLILPNTAAFTIGGATTDINRYRVLQAAPGFEYDPATGTGALILKRTRDTGGTNGSGITVGENFCQLLRFGIEAYNPSGTQYPLTNTNNVGVELSAQSILVDGVTVRWKIGESGGTGFIICFADLQTGNKTNVFRNCIAIGSGMDLLGAGVGFHAATDDQKFYNCVAYGMLNSNVDIGSGGSTNGFFTTSADTDVTLTNCVATLCGIDFDTTVGNTLSYCVSSDDTAIGTGSRTLADPETLFNSPLFDDFRPRYGGALIDNGIAIGGMTTDILGLTRILPWEIGAYDGYVIPPSPGSETVETYSIGSGKDYATCQEFLDAHQRNLVAENVRVVGQLYDQELLSGTLELVAVGAVSDASRFRTLEAAPSLYYDPKNAVGAKVSGNGLSVIRVQENFFQLRHLGIEQLNSAGAGSEVDRYGLIVEAARSVAVDACWIALELGKPLTERVCVWSKLGDFHHFTNTIARGGSNTVGATTGWKIDSNRTDVDHCVAHRCRFGSVGTGFAGSGSGNRLRNCISGVTDFDFDAGLTASASHCLGEDTTITGPGAIQNAVMVETFYAADTNDYRLISGSLAIGSGINAGVLTDFLGVQRRAPHNRGVYAGFVLVELKPADPIQLMRRTRCYDLVRPSDGVSLFLTEHDAPLEFRGKDYTPVGGFDGSASERVAGLRVADIEFQGPMSLGVIVPEDILAHRWDDALVFCYYVDHKEPFRGAKDTTVWRAQAWSFDKERWRCSLVSVIDLLTRVNQDVKSRTCTYKLFSNDPVRGHFCLLNRADWEVLAVDVDTVIDDRLSFDVVLGAGAGEMPAQDDDYYVLGEVVWRTGGNVGIVSEIKTWDSVTGVVELQLKTPFPILATDTFDVTPGDDKRRETCFDKFDNIDNFGGDALVPGTSQTIRSPR